MIITKVFCDHCGRVLNENHDYVDIKIEANHKTYDVDLCDECFEKLCCVIHKFCENQKAIEANKCTNGNEYLNGIYSKDVKTNVCKNN